MAVKDSGGAFYIIATASATLDFESTVITSCSAGQGSTSSSSINGGLAYV